VGRFPGWQSACLYKPDSGPFGRKKILIFTRIFCCELARNGWPPALFMVGLTYNSSGILAGG
jgi:hypothetical protein